MKRKGWRLLIIAFIALFFISLYFDSAIIKHVSLFRNSYLDNFFLLITMVSSELIVFFVLTALFLWKEHKKRWILPLWLSLGFSVLVSFVLKATIQRQRPFQLGLVELIPQLYSANYTTWNFSFPSFQSMLVFCTIPILAIQFPRFKKIFMVFAALVAFSRVYFGVHFMSDIIAGGLIGYAIGMIIVYSENKIQFGKRIYEKIFRK